MIAVKTESKKLKRKNPSAQKTLHCKSKNECLQFDAAYEITS